MEKQLLKTVRTAIKQWYIPFIVGLIFICAGIWTFLSPLESYLTLSLVFSLAFLISGIFEIVFSISNRKEIDNWGWTLIFGIATMLIGILLLVHPEISITTLPLYVGFLLLFRSIGGVSYALDLKDYGVIDWGYLMAVGILGIIFSFILIWNPVFAGATIIFWTGITLIAGGVFSIHLSLKLRKLKKLS
jgi:uncharacterized membrane protein HdeD (DUF308 family)